LSQEQLADRSGLSVRTIRNLERGRAGRRSTTVLLIDALSLDDAERAAVRRVAGAAGARVDGGGGGGGGWVAGAVDPVGDWGTALVLREALYGARRFEQFQRRLGLSRAVLAQRLQRLTDEGMLGRVPYQQQQQPIRYEYRLTETGREFCTALAAMIRWGDRWPADPGGPPIVEFLDRETGRPVHPEMVDATTGRPIDLRRIIPTTRPGPPHQLTQQMPKQPEPSTPPNRT